MWLKKAEEVKKVTHLEDCTSVICWNIFTTAFHTVFYFKEKVPPNMKVLSCTRSHVVPNLYDFSVFCGTENEKFGRNSKLALFYAITVNGDWRFQTLKKEAKAPYQHHKMYLYDYLWLTDGNLCFYSLITKPVNRISLIDAHWVCELDQPIHSLTAPVLIDLHYMEKSEMFTWKFTFCVPGKFNFWSLFL